MFTAATLALFTSASLLLAVAPGPDNIFVLTESMVRGWRVGLIVTLGLCTGLIVHTAAVALGVAALFQASALAFNLLKFVGAAYLAYLAWGAFRAGAASLDSAAGEAVGPGRYYLRGIVMNVTNPKVSIFFLAFLPQFIDAAVPDKAFSFLVLGAWFAAQSALFLAVLVGITGLLRQRARSSIFGSASAGRWLQGLGGLLFLGLAARLARTEAPVP